jgi:hypothetical protein
VQPLLKARQKGDRTERVEKKRLERSRRAEEKEGDERSRTGSEAVVVNADEGRYGARQKSVL